MKNIITLIALVGCIAFSSAQEQEKDIFEREGNLIKATLFHDNGEVSQTGFYTLEGKLHGDWVSFSNDGVKTAEAHYDNGVKSGKWFFWQDNNILKEVDYSESRITSVNTWKIQDERIVTAD